MKTIYIAGAITSDPKYKLKFSNAEGELAKEGYIAVNPALLPSAGFSWEAYIRMSEAMLAECDAACFLPDWKNSRGAMFEFGYAVANGKEIIMYADWLEKRNAPHDATQEAGVKA